MQPTQDKYPVFEANQVLTNRHLNQVFSYLDEQERLTRANLIGIGIVCGLEISLGGTAAAPAIHLTKGCGVTSEGYLIIEPGDVDLVSYKPYTLPTDVDYPPFRDLSQPLKPQYALWEMFPVGEPDTTALGNVTGFLNDKAVLLFLELKKDGLRNCSPNNCDDKGAEVTATVRRLLINRADLDKIIAAANKLDTDLTPADLEAALSARLKLVDLRLPRYDVPNTSPTTSNEVLAAFFEVFHANNLAVNTGNALTAAYTAFSPLLEEDFPSNPFAGFNANFGFLDTAPLNTTQVRFLQYYYDFFDDLIKAYDEFRWKGLELMCACCPPSELFPRHLMLGLLFPATVATPAIYRHLFLASSAISGCEGHTKDLLLLFRRLVEMVARFTNNPTLPTPAPNSRTDVQIRITPSKLADVPVSDKAIPYYYLQTGTPPLFHLWNPQKTNRGRANQNLSYRSDEYNPPAPPFVLQPLRYDIEPHNFLRIEGHLGKNYQLVLNTLLQLKTQNRLPIEIIALRTGAFDEKQEVDLSKEDCRFQDLETLYDTLKADLICFLCRETQYFYDIPFEINSKITTKTKPKLPLLLACDPAYEVSPQSLGRIFEDWMAAQPGGLIPDIDPNVIINFLNTTNAGQSNIILFYIIIYLSKVYVELPDDLTQFDLAAFEKRYKDLVSVAAAIEKEREQVVANIEGNVNLMNWEEIDDRLEDIIYACRLDVFKAIVDEYKRRIKEVRQKQFLSYFLQNNPGIQHKAGVPLGGTFILVYHDDPEPVINPGLNLNFNDFVGNIGIAQTTGNLNTANINPAVRVNMAALSESFNRISANPAFLVDPDIRFVLGSITGTVPSLTPTVVIGDEADKVIATAVNELADGTVIADFFLPYICCSDCSPVQFVLPKVPPTFSALIGCTNPNNQAEVTLTPVGGMAPYSFKADSGAFQALGGPVLLSAGVHTLVIRDAEGVESAPQTITVASQLLLGESNFDCLGDTGEYIVVFPVSGGTPPYTANRGSFFGNNYSSDALPGEVETEIVITDSQKCTVSRKVRHSCIPPLAFTTSLGCTTPNNTAPITVVPTGGVAPYAVRVGTGAFTPLTGPISVPVGSQKIVVRDAAGTETSAQNVVVPGPIVLTITDFACDANAAYRTFISIQGGAPPYIANGKPVVGNVFTTDPVPSGQTTSVEVVDQNKCSAKLETQHVCEAPCNLPCAGASRRCDYRMWLQAPAKETAYEIYRQETVVRFRFNGEDISLTGSNNILQVPANQLNGDFKNAAESVIKALNERINQALIAKFGPTGANRLVLTYEPTAADPFTVFKIEHFVCETFSIEFNYSFSQPSPAFSFTVRYTNEPDATGLAFDGAIFINRRLNNKETRIPTFNCSERNLCSNSAFKPLCDGKLPDLGIQVTPLTTGANRFSFAGSASNMPVAEILAWVWDVPRGLEPFYEGIKTDVQVSNPQVRLRLTAITRKGCFSILERPILQ